MTSERHASYVNALKLIDRKGAAALHEAELAVLRETAEDQLLSETSQEGALRAARTLLDHLAESGRWTPEAADELYAALRSTGPEFAPVA